MTNNLGINVEILFFVNQNIPNLQISLCQCFGQFGKYIKFYEHCLTNFFLFLPFWNTEHMKPWKTFIFIPWNYKKLWRALWVRILSPPSELSYNADVNLFGQLLVSEPKNNIQWFYAFSFKSVLGSGDSNENF